MATKTTTKTTTDEGETVKTDNEGVPVTRRVDYFGGRSHGYLLDGRKVPGVTTLLNKGMPHPQFGFADVKKAARYAVENLDMLGRMSPEAAIDLVSGEPGRERNDAAERGKLVHDVVYNVVVGNEVDIPDDLAGSVEQLARFMREWQIEPVAAEFAVVNRTWRYCGTVDLMARYGPHRKLGLFDYKTGASGVFPDVAYQLAGYAWSETYYTDPSSSAHHVEHRMPLAPGEPPPDHTVLDPDTGETIRVPADDTEHERFDLCAAVWLQDDGYELYPVDAGPTTYREFLYVAQVAQIVERADERRDTLILPAVSAPVAPSATGGDA